MAEKGTKARMIADLKREGKSNTEIAQEVRVSRQYVHSVLHGRPRRESRRPLNEDLLTTSEAAQLLKVASNTIRKWSERGLISSYRIGPRGDRRFDRTEVIEYLKSHKVPVRGEEVAGAESRVGKQIGKGLI